MVVHSNISREHKIIEGTAYKQKNGILSDQWLKLLDALSIGAFTVNMERRITSMNGFMSS